MDQNGTPIGNGESGNGAPPKVISSVIPDAMKYDGQPIHYQMEVTDANGRNSLPME